MKLQKFTLAIIFLAALIRAAFSQDLDSKLHLLIEKNKIKELRTNIESAKRKYPDLHTIFYVEAFIEIDGEIAVQKYRDFIKRFSKSPYVVNAQYKIAQFYFAKGLYRSANQILYRIISFYPNSTLIDDATYLMIRSLLALQNFEQAKQEIKNFIKNYRLSPFKKLAEHDLEQLNKPGSKQFQRQSFQSTKNLHLNYAIQIGAFRNQENAIKQKNMVSNWGYTTDIIQKIINNNIFYLVWIGDFETEEQALNFGEIFKKKYSLSFRVVKKESER